MWEIRKENITKCSVVKDVNSGIEKQRAWPIEFNGRDGPKTKHTDWGIQVV